MEINKQTFIPDLPEYLYYGNFERMDEINNRIFERTHSDIPMTPKYDIRSVNTDKLFFL